MNHRSKMRSLLLIVIAFTVTIGSGCSHGAKTPKLNQNELTSTYLDMGTNALVNNDIPRAVEYLRRAIEADQKNYIAHNHLGLAYMSMGEGQKAFEEFQQSVTIQKDYSDGYINLGAWAFSKNELEAARSHYERALANLEYRDRYRGLTGLAQVELTQGHDLKAKEKLFESLRDNKEYCLSHFLLGTIYMREGNPMKAQGEFKASIKGTCSANIDGQYQLAHAYLRLKEYKKARTQFGQIMEQFPNTALADRAGEDLRAIP